MARASQRPVAPRLNPPDLPSDLEAAAPAPDADLLQARLDGLRGDTDLAHSRLEEVLIPGADIAALTLTGATLIDVDIEDLRAVEVQARRSSLRRVRIAGGRIGTLDLANARISELELLNVRIDYLYLAGAELEDVRITSCTIRAIDLPGAKLARVSFADSSADEVDPRGMRATDLDLRGLDAATILDPLALRGATLSGDQVFALAPRLAAAAGIDVR